MDKYVRRYERHLDELDAQFAAIPCFRLYVDCRGSPPGMTAAQAHEIGARIRLAETEFQRRITESWKHCLRKMPKALDRAWDQVRITVPVVAPRQAVQRPPTPRPLRILHPWGPW